MAPAATRIRQGRRSEVHPGSARDASGLPRLRTAGTGRGTALAVAAVSAEGNVRHRTESKGVYSHIVAMLLYGGKYEKNPFSSSRCAVSDIIWALLDHYRLSDRNTQASRGSHVIRRKICSSSSGIDQERHSSSDKRRDITIRPSEDMGALQPRLGVPVREA